MKGGGDVQLEGRYARLYHILDWLVFLATANLNWIAGVLAGGIIIGVAPATLALHDVLWRALSTGDLETVAPFWRRWRAELLIGQMSLGFPLVSVWVLVFYLLRAAGSPWAVPATIVTAGYLLTLQYLPALLVHQGPATVSTSWGVAVHVAWRNPVTTVGLASANVLITAGILRLAPAAFFFFVPVVPALAVTTVTRRILHER